MKSSPAGQRKAIMVSGNGAALIINRPDMLSGKGNRYKMVLTLKIIFQ
jgi:hypothetical protein